MQAISASYAKKNFDDAVSMVFDGPVSIEKHGKVVVILASPNYSNMPDRDELKKVARLRQQNSENERLIRHQQVAIRLLSGSAGQAKDLVEKARAEVRRWEALKSCSNDYIEKWDAILQHPVREIAKLICSDLDGWGLAMRQNSPWKMALYEERTA